MGIVNPEIFIIAVIPEEYKIKYHEIFSTLNN